MIGAVSSHTNGGSGGGAGCLSLIPSGDWYNRALSTALIHAAAVRSGSAPMPTHAAHTAQVLLIDDVDMRDVAQIILEDAGYTVAVAPDGAAALDVLRQAARLPDLILLDLQMPILDGRTFRRHQQAVPCGARSP